MYHDAKGKASDDGVFDGNGGEVELTNMTSKSLSESTKGVLTE